MPACTICGHPARREIDVTLCNAGASVRALGRRYQVTPMALCRHRKTHIPQDMANAAAKAQDVEDVRQAINVVEQLKVINGVTIAILKEARDRGDADVALRAIDRVQKQIELQAKMLELIDERPVINLVVLPEWVDLRTRILRALDPFPAAKMALVESLNGAAGR